jgi:hypothetical protein
LRRPSAADLLRLAALAAALVLSAWMVTRSRAGGDQLNLLARGWLLAARGELVAWGNPLSSGGNGPGSLTSIVVGVPIALWRDHRAPVVLLWLAHLAAWLLLDRTLKSALTPFERTAYAVLWALIPWRIEASALLWNPNYLILVGAVHLATAAAARERARFAISFTHVLALGLGAQLHPSVLLLGVTSMILWWRGHVRVSWSGFAAGVAATAVSLIPWLRALGAPPPGAPAWNGFPFRGLLLVQPWLKGLSYWFRYPSLAIGRHTAHFDFTEALGAPTDRWLAPAAQVVVALGSIATLAFAIWANARLFRPARAALRGRSGEEVPPRAWLIAYVACTFAAACAVFAASPTTPQSWQGLPVVHVAILPVALGWGELFRRIGARRAMAGLVTLAALAGAIDVAIATASPDFRCRGRETVVFPLRSWSPMFDELGLQRSCPWPLERPGTWWPDVLPEETPVQPQPAAANQ